MLQKNEKYFQTQSLEILFIEIYEQPNDRWKKSVAEKIVYNALDRVEAKIKRAPVEGFS